QLSARAHQPSTSLGFPDRGNHRGVCQNVQERQMATGCLEGKIREFAGRRLWHGSCNAWARNRSCERVLVKKGRPMNQEKGGTEKEQATPTPESGRARILVGFDALEESNEPLEQALSFTQMMSVASIDIAWVPPP